MYKEIVEYNNRLYIIHDKITYSIYGSNNKKSVYYLIDVSNLPNKISFTNQNYIIKESINDSINFKFNSINKRYGSKTTKIKNGELYYKYKIEET